MAAADTTTTLPPSTVPLPSPQPPSNTEPNPETQSSRPTSSDSPRPPPFQRKTSSMIVPADHPDIEAKTPTEFPPDDARAMSPRQSSENLAAICSESRGKIQDSTIEHQSSLAALIERIESVKSGHEKLERDNNALQEYIGGLTRSMSKTALGSAGKK